MAFLGRTIFCGCDCRGSKSGISSRALPIPGSVLKKVSGTLEAALKHDDEEPPESSRHLFQRPWLQLCIPEVGWRRFDPTDGVLANSSHIRVACGRHDRDAAPTSGTLYSSATETMSIEVHVAEG